MLANNCNYGISNTGQGCTPLFTVTKKIFLRPYTSAQNNVNTLLLTPSGTITTAGSTTLTGVGTKFQTELNVGDVISVAGEGTRVVKTITSNTAGTVDRAFVTSLSGLAYNQFNLAYFTALINQPDPSKRLYPLPTMKNAKDKRDAGIFETWDDGMTSLVQQGPRKFTAIFTSQDKAASAQLKRQLDSITGQNDIGFYALSLDKNLWGAANIQTQLDARRIDQGSFQVIYNPGDDKETAKIEMTFCVHEDEDDGLIACIANNEMATDLQQSIARLTGLLDVTPVISAIGTGGFTIVLNTIFGTIKNPLTVKGLTAANFISSSTGLSGKIYNTTSAADDSVTVTEVLSNGRPTGTYTITLTASSADVLQPNIVAPGYDMTALNTTTIVIP